MQMAPSINQQAVESTVVFRNALEHRGVAVNETRRRRTVSLGFGIHLPDVSLAISFRDRFDTACLVPIERSAALLRSTQIVEHGEPILIGGIKMRHALEGD